MQQYDTFLFDWDGTLADSTQVWVDVVRNELAGYGLKPDEPEILSTLGDFALMKRFGLTTDQFPVFCKTVRRKAHELLVASLLFDGVPEMLAALHNRGRRLAVVTATQGETIRKMLDHHRLGDFLTPL